MKQVVLMIVANNGDYSRIYQTEADFLAALSDAYGYPVSGMDEASKFVRFLAQTIVGMGNHIHYCIHTNVEARLRRLVFEGEASEDRTTIIASLGEMAAAALRDLAQTPEPPSPDIIILTDSNGWPSGVFTFGDNARPLRYVLVSANEGSIPASEAHVATVDGHFKDFAAVEAEIRSRI